MDKGLIFETNHWRTILAADQTYLGRLVIVLKRPCGDLADITQEECLDFLEVVKKIEKAYRKALDATMFNYSCLMNNAYQNNRTAPQKIRCPKNLWLEPVSAEPPGAGNPTNTMGCLKGSPCGVSKKP